MTIKNKMNSDFFVLSYLAGIKDFFLVFIIVKLCLKIK